MSSGSRGSGSGPSKRRWRSNAGRRSPLGQAVQLGEVLVPIRGVEEVDAELVPRRERRPRHAPGDERVRLAHFALANHELLRKEQPVLRHVPQEHGGVAVRVVGYVDLVVPVALGDGGAGRRSVDEQIHQDVGDRAIVDVEDGSREGCELPAYAKPLVFLDGLGAGALGTGLHSLSRYAGRRSERRGAEQGAGRAKHENPQDGSHHGRYPPSGAMPDGPLSGTLTLVSRPVNSSSGEKWPCAAVDESGTVRTLHAMRASVRQDGGRE